MLQVPRSTYYAWVGRAGKVTATQARREVLEQRVREVFEDSGQVFGSRRVCVVLNEQGTAVSLGTVAKVMRHLGLVAISKRAFKRTTKKDPGAQTFPDRVNRNFDAEDYRPGEVLVGDITYLKTGEGWLYLAVFIDLATRMVVGWQIAPHMRTSLLIDALEMARVQYAVAPGAIIHTDHGTQMTSKQFRHYCQDHGFIQSMGATGVCWDNAVAESFFSGLKNEMYHHHVFASRQMARHKVAAHIEVFYNRKRPHSAINYQTPTTAWNWKQEQQQAA